MDFYRPGIIMFSAGDCGDCIMSRSKSISKAFSTSRYPIYQYTSIKLTDLFYIRLDGTSLMDLVVVID